MELGEQELKTLLTTTSNAQRKDLKLAHKRLKEQEVVIKRSRNWQIVWKKLFLQILMVSHQS